jgi:hypothetical protein
MKGRFGEKRAIKHFPPAQAIIGRSILKAPVRRLRQQTRRWKTGCSNLPKKIFRNRFSDLLH